MKPTITSSLVLIAALVQIMAPAIINPFSGGQNALRANVASQIEPAGYAFAIWGPIYLLAVAYSIWQLSPAGRADPLSWRIAPFAIVLYSGSTLWLAAVKYGPIWASIPILAIMTICACAALIMATSRSTQSASRWWLVVLPFGFYAGWITCAIFVNIAEVAPTYGFNRFGLTVPAYAALSLIAATLLASTMLLLTKGELAYGATVVWALVAIMVAGWQRDVAAIVVTTTACGMMAILALSLWLKTNGRKPLPVPAS
ncbi:MAG: hypothetical protein ACRCWO_04590 [Bosea sp. (in: a-proteobacteria)]